MDGPHHHRSDFDPVLIGVCGILAGAIVVAAYHCFTTHYTHLHTRNANPPNEQQSSRNNNHHHGGGGDEGGGGGEATSTSHSTIVNIPISAYTKQYSEETCSVCLSEFSEGEAIRVLPECLHLFHAPCIDSWLKLHSNCPLCRAKAIPARQTVLSILSRIPEPEVHQVPEPGG
ncbi:hypothetical protein K2173_002003 [Erythroxylum novogranatense]|uniref:RING-type E3 ubiquitin transferase n=1 Tax=Erythroxylum novogranatense TaxID=1862640 RepID=A0AAV8SPD3_9ROSI|nr:hypothetical protein K2173_002003 [Erythroxylum novogranatense]